MSSSEDSKSCCCSCLLYGVGFFLLTIAVLWQTKFKYHVKMFVYLWCLIIGGLVGGTISIPFGKNTNNHFRIFTIFQTLCSFLHVKFTVRNRQNMDSDEPFIMIANHQSSLDVLGMSYVWPKNCVVMLKSSLKFLPGFNLCALMCHSIYIDRFSKEKAHMTLDKTFAAIKDDKRKVWIYPEGTRNPEDTMLPFKKGAFTLAHQAKIPVVCCVFSSHKTFYDWANRRFDDSGEVLADILPPVDSTKFASAEELSDHCRSIMMTAFERLNKEVAEKSQKKIN